MRITVLGSGTPDGWPNPWCSCSSCTAARGQQVLRTQSSVLLDERVVIDVGPSTASHDLSRVTVALVTHNHVDHHFPQAWVWRAWATTGGPLTVLAPPTVLGSAAFDRAVTALPVAPGDRHVVDGYEVRVLDAEHPDDAVLFDVTGPDGGRLLYGSDTGVLPAQTVEALRDRDFHVVMLELAGTPIPSHLTLETWPAQVDRLRAAGAVTGRTQVVATHLGHHNPPPNELDIRLDELGARAARDGDVLDTAGGRRVLVLGGQSSGKSAYAEQLVHGAVTYVATAPPRTDDADWARRVADHARRRPASWTTLETGDITGVLSTPGGPVLVDDLGLWVTRVLDGHWESDRARDVFAAALDDLAKAWEATTRQVVLVSPEVGSGVVPLNAAARLFADLLGRATTTLAGLADEVVQVVAGQPRRLR
ncbi:MAG: bifunctional adenosylcobinamide kinase/adenosylcobinamide-phosphate guanylyltransferase [Actinomycetota bacterium]|nr:bifunctional adenosylcobinamide kinase/adenosylcobinamide-phosphate guanylyltransferase [Actinomycetota bacterium]